MSEEINDIPFSAEEVTRMVDHMNADHADSVLAYVQHFGARPEATAAKLLHVEPEEMHIKAMKAEGEERLVIAFDHRLTSGRDAHMTMVKMSKQAKQALKDKPGGGSLE